MNKKIVFGERKLICLNSLFLLNKFLRIVTISPLIPINTCLPVTNSDDVNSIKLNNSHSAITQSPILWIEGGILIAENNWHTSNALSSIDVHPQNKQDSFLSKEVDKILTVTKLVQQSNAQFPIDSTEEGIVIFFNNRHSDNA